VSPFVSIPLVTGAIVFGGPLEDDAFVYAAPLDCPGREVAFDHLREFAGEAIRDSRVDRVEIVIDRSTDAGPMYVAALQIVRGGEVGTHALQSPSCETVVRASALLVAVVMDPVEALAVTEARTGPDAVTNDVPVQRPRGPDETAARSASASTSASDQVWFGVADGDAKTHPEADLGEDGEEVESELEPVPQIFDGERPGPISLATRANDTKYAPLEPGFRDAMIVAGGGGGLGPFPGGAGSVGGSVGVRFARFRLELGALHWFSRGYDHPDGSGDGADVAVTTGRILGCWEPRRGSQLSFPLCGGLDAGGAVGRGYGQLSRSSREVAPWIAGTATVGLWWRFVGPLAVTVNAEASVGITRPVFDIDGKRAPVVAANRGVFRAFAGLGAHFP